MAMRPKKKMRAGGMVKKMRGGGMVKKMRGGGMVKKNAQRRNGKEEVKWLYLEAQILSLT